MMTFSKLFAKLDSESDFITILDYSILQNIKSSEDRDLRKGPQLRYDLL